MSFPAFNDVADFSAPQQTQLQQHDSYLQGYLGVQHKDDGSHGDVTADSLHLVKGNPTTGTATGSGNLTVDGTTTVSAVSGSTLVLTGPPITASAVTNAIGSILTAQSPTGNVQGCFVQSVAMDGTAVLVALANDTANSGTAAELILQYKNQALTISKSNNFAGLTIPGGSAYFQFSSPIAEQNRTTAMGFWTAFTPSLTNLTIGNGSLTGSYARIGKTSFVEVLVVFGSTTSVSGQVSLTGLPTNNLASATAQRLGHLMMFDNDTGGSFTGTAISAGNTSATLLTQGAPCGVVSATGPFTWAVSDQLHIFLNYQEL